jgi:hypothetical protein
MVYKKPDGTLGFSWEQQLEFLKREHPDYLPEILYTQLMISNPDLARAFDREWAEGKSYEEDNEIARQFMEQHGLSL